VGFRHARLQDRLAGQAITKLGVTHEAANPLLGLQEFQPEYDELQVKIRCPRQQGYQGNKDTEKREGYVSSVSQFQAILPGMPRGTWHDDIRELWRT
jgi:hypothetical protein